MKGLMPWVKRNLTIVILSAVMLLILPGAFAGSWMWNSSIKKKRQAEVANADQQLGNSGVTYYLPPTTPGGQPQTYKAAAPSSAITKYFKEQKDRVQSQMNELVTGAQTLNSRGHKLLLEGVFPTPTDKLKTLELADLLVGKPDKPSILNELLAGVRAGPPADPAPIADQLLEMQNSALERIKAESGRTQFTAEEQTALTAQLLDARLGQYRRHASEIGVYATRASLPGSLPKATPTEPPDVNIAYRWQADYWLTQDLLAAIAEANTQDGKPTSVERSVVKRIESMSLEPLGTPATPSVTGRTGGGANGTYDLRHAEMTLVVSSERLPQLIDAISRTNLMTVVGLSLAEATPWQDLDSGYFYGAEHVVRATVRVQSVWLRSWTFASMPEEIKKGLSGEDTSQQAAAPAPVTRAPSPPPDAGSRKPTTPAKKGPANKRGGRGGGE